MVRYDRVKKNTFKTNDTATFRIHTDISNSQQEVLFTLN